MKWHWGQSFQPAVDASSLSFKSSSSRGQSVFSCARVEHLVQIRARHLLHSTSVWFLFTKIHSEHVLTGQYTLFLDLTSKHFFLNFSNSLGNSMARACFIPIILSQQRTGINDSSVVAEINNWRKQSIQKAWEQATEYTVHNSKQATQLDVDEVSFSRWGIRQSFFDRDFAVGTLSGLLVSLILLYSGALPWRWDEIYVIRLIVYQYCLKQCSRLLIIHS